MARYRQKDDIDLGWNTIRRRITRELDTQIAEYRERTLNELLAKAWGEYKAAIGTGVVLELDAKHSAFVAEVLSEVIDVTVDGPEREAA